MASPNANTGMWVAAGVCCALAVSCSCCCWAVRGMVMGAAREVIDPSAYVGRPYRDALDLLSVGEVSRVAVLREGTGQRYPAPPPSTDYGVVMVDSGNAVTAVYTPDLTDVKAWYEHGGVVREYTNFKEQYDHVAADARMTKRMQELVRR